MEILNTADKLVIKRKRFIVMTSDRKQILMGKSSRICFENVDSIRSNSIKTFSSIKKAKDTILKSWLKTYIKEADFEDGGKYIIVPIMETLQEI